MVTFKVVIRQNCDRPQFERLAPSSFSAERIGWLPCLCASTPVRLADGSVSVPSRPHSGESGVATAIAGLACPTVASSARLPRSAVLGNAATTVVRLAETLSRGDTRDGCPLASHRLSLVLGLALAGSAPSRPQSGEPGGAPPDLSHGGGEPDLGRTPHSRRVAHVGLRYLRAQRIAMDETCSRNPHLAKRWLVFLRNHREAIAAMDFRLGTSSPLHSRSLSHRGCGQDLPLPDNISVSGLCESTSPLAVKRQS